jgi:hypothetical protein
LRWHTASQSLHNPPLLVVSDIETIVVHPNFVNRANRPTTITLDDLLTPAGAARELVALRDGWLNPPAHPKTCSGSAR